MKMLVVAAHPDDEVLGCGGTISRLSREGHELYVAILGEGITSRYDQREQADTALIKALHERSRDVGKLLGAKEVILHNLPDNRFDTVPLLDAVKVVENLIIRITPDVIYTHHGGDLNIDHALVHRAVLTATRPTQGHCVREIYAFEVPSSTEWAFQRFGPAFRANVFMDIARSLDIKVRALAIYETEGRAFPHPRSPEALQAIARRWGSVVGCEAAEAFELIRSIR
jgi:LmbE family N-acetylglucosaminyl deacetylase